MKNLSELKSKELLPSKTWKYLSVTLRIYGTGFLKHLRSVYCVAMGINDHELIKSTGEIYNNHLFCLIDTDIYKTTVDALDYFRDHESYELDYPFDHPNLNLHMLVFRIPSKYDGVMRYLKNAQYSKMFSESELFRIFNASERKFDSFKVLTKDSDYKEVFEDKINALGKQDDADGRTRITIPDSAELDFPFKLEDEIFNYDESLVLETV